MRVALGGSLQADPCPCSERRCWDVPRVKDDGSFLLDLFLYCCCSRCGSNAPLDFLKHHPLPKEQPTDKRPANMDSPSAKAKVLEKATRLQPVPVQKTLLMINHFSVSTVTFLNQFVRTVDERLEVFSKSMDKLDVLLAILEAKLEKIEGPPAPAPAPAPAAATAEATPASQGTATAAAPVRALLLPSL